jgi:hypothetical protein
MADVSYDDIVKLAEQLPESEQNKLIYHLRAKQAADKSGAQSASAPSEGTAPAQDEWDLKRGSEYVNYYRDPTREELIEELDSLRKAGKFDNVESLYGKFANPNVPEMSEEDFHAQMHAIATEWEQELDEFDADEH